MLAYYSLVDYQFKLMDTKLFPTILFETARAWRTQLDKRLKPLGLSQAKWRTLLHISRAAESLTQKKLAAQMNIEGPTLVGLLDRLEKDGWIKRCADAADRRNKIIQLTPKAKTALKKIHATVDQLRDELVSTLPNKAFVSCIKTLQQIKEKIVSLD